MSKPSKTTYCVKCLLSYCLSVFKDDNNKKERERDEGKSSSNSFVLCRFGFGFKSMLKLRERKIDSRQQLIANLILAYFNVNTKLINEKHIVSRLSSAKNNS